MSDSSETDVLVVGAGPVGLSLSILLGRLGIAHRVVERREGLHFAPQAHVVSARTMEIFRVAGIDPVALQGVATPPGDLASVQWVHTLAGPELGRLALITPERLAKLLSVTAVPQANISQHRLEPDAIDAQGDHFDTTGLDLGIHYERGALVPDGTTPPSPANPVSDVLPSTCPGARLPHVWLERAGERISTHDLLDLRKPILLSASRAWHEAALALGLPAYRIGPGGDVADPESAWTRVCEISDVGAIIVRPDGHVGWRAQGFVADPRAVLSEALARILPS